MRNLRDLSGSWVGFWVQRRERGEMRLTLRFGDRTIEGEGSDRVGAFTIRGSFSEEGGIVGFVKTYPSHPVDYKGVWDGAMIAGKWRISRFGGSGEFEIWPEKDDQAIERMEEALAVTG